LTRTAEVVILMELWPSVQDRFGPGTEVVLALLESLGFEVRRLIGGRQPLGERLTPASSIPERAHPKAYLDVLCMRPGGSRFARQG
jgi:hypothetical protein